MPKPDLGLCKILEKYQDCLNDIEKVVKKSTVFSANLPQQQKLNEYVAPFRSLDSEAKQLIKSALKARMKAYCPYSNFKVGAAFLTNCGTIYTGCNIENVAFSPTSCAERTAMVKAVSEGHQRFCAGAVVAYNPSGFTTPCGVCRQFMIEFVDQDMPVYVAIARDGGGKMIEDTDEVLVTSVFNLLPHSFTASH